MLTRKQADLLHFIEQHLSTQGIPPSFEEMKSAVNIQSKSGIHRLITALEERGFIRRIPHRARALEVLRSSKTAMPPSTDAVAVEKLRMVPVINQPESPWVSVSNDFLGEPQTDIYGIRIVDDSMNMAGILAGDTALIRRDIPVREGDIVAVTIDNNKTVLRYYHQNDNQITLKPANSDYPCEDLAGHQISIDGNLAGLLRRY